MNTIAVHIPHDITHATTINFWAIFFICTLKVAFHNIFIDFIIYYYAPISFGIMITGSVIDTEHFHKMNEIISYKNIIQHISPYITIQLVECFNQQSAYNLIIIKNNFSQIHHLISINLAIISFIIYIKCILKLNLHRVYIYFYTDLFILYISSVSYILL
jgi:hypothetical protein